MTTRTAALRLDRVSLNVADLTAAAAFYTEALGFEAATAVDADPRLAELLGARAFHITLMRRGQQRLELAMFDPPGASYPADSRSNDLWFQHCALVTGDIGASYRRLCRFPFTPISRHGPQALPGDIIAFKFRDPDGHPLELVEFQGPIPEPRRASIIPPYPFPTPNEASLSTAVAWTLRAIPANQQRFGTGRAG